ncbi:MAG: uL15 family ribosomal protein [archaeon]|nr:MAG: uL15 family ribosomal protein [archaeon]
MKRKRSKRSRLRGNRRGYHGHKFKSRGKGSTGGKGNAGTGKMAGHKRTYVLKYHKDYLGKHGFKSKKVKFKVINLNRIKEKVQDFLKRGIAKKEGKEVQITLKNYKILASGDLGSGFLIKATEFSKKAKEKIKSAGSKTEKL